jgi:hypothetical protein
VRAIVLYEAVVKDYLHLSLPGTPAEKRLDAIWKATTSNDIRLQELWELREKMTESSIVDFRLVVLR